MLFKDRLAAGTLLAEKLKKYKNDPGIILAVPRGGVPVAYAVARELGFPVEVILTKKIGHPLNKEYAIGAATLTDYFVVPHEKVSEQYIQQQLNEIRSRLKKMYKHYIGDRQPASLQDKTVIVIDDGIATGNTITGVIRMLRKKNPYKIIIGAPVASKNAFQELSRVADDVVVVEMPELFFGVGSFYENFEQVEDDEVMFYLDKLKQVVK